MACLKKFFLCFYGLASISMVENTFADTSYPVSSPEYDEAIKAAADSFVDYLIRTDGGSVELSGPITYSEIDNNYSLSDGNPQFLTQISLKRITFSAHAEPLGVPPSDVTATISLVNNVIVNNGHCEVKTGSGKYKIVSFTPQNMFLKGLLERHLKDDGDEILNTFIKHSSLQNNYCAH